MKILIPKSLLISLVTLTLGSVPASGWHLAGRVICDANGNRLVDVNDTPVQGVIVAIESTADGFTGTVMTDATGAYSLEVPHTPDNYLVYMHPPSVPPGATLISPADGVYAVSLAHWPPGNTYREGLDFLLNCAPNPPPPSGNNNDCGKVTGGGWIVGTPSGKKANFGMSGGPGGWGHLNFVDHGSGLHVRSTAVTAYELDPQSSEGRIVRYNVLIGSTAGTAVVRVVDNGEPGTRDLFEIKLSTGFTAGGELGGARPGGGNIQLHKCPEGKKQ